MATIKGKWLLNLLINHTDAGAFSTPVQINYSFTADVDGDYAKQPCSEIAYFYYSSTNSYNLGQSNSAGFYYMPQGSIVLYPQWYTRILDFGTEQFISEADLAKIKAIAKPIPEDIKIPWFLNYKTQDLHALHNHITEIGGKLCASPSALNSSGYFSLDEISYDYLDGFYYFTGKGCQYSSSGQLLDGNVSYTLFTTNPEVEIVEERILDLTESIFVPSEGLICFLLDNCEPAVQKAYTEGYIKEICKRLKTNLGISAPMSPYTLACLARNNARLTNYGTWRFKEDMDSSSWDDYITTHSNGSCIYDLQPDIYALHFEIPFSIPGELEGNSVAGSNMTSTSEFKVMEFHANGEEGHSMYYYTSNTYHSASNFEIYAGYYPDFSGSAGTITLHAEPSEELLDFLNTFATRVNTDLEALGALCDWDVMLDSESRLVVSIENKHPSYYLKCTVTNRTAGNFIDPEDNSILNNTLEVTVAPGDIGAFALNSPEWGIDSVYIDNMRWTANE